MEREIGGDSEDSGLLFRLVSRVKNAGQKTKDSICYVLCVFIKLCEMRQDFFFSVIS
jgi:hypothetical protein